MAGDKTADQTLSYGDQIRKVQDDARSEFHKTWEDKVKLSLSGWVEDIKTQVRRRTGVEDKYAIFTFTSESEEGMLYQRPFVIKLLLETHKFTAVDDIPLTNTASDKFTFSLRVYWDKSR